MKICCLKSVVKTLGRDRTEVATISLDVRNSTALLKKVRADAEIIRRRSAKFENDVHEKRALATMESACVKELSQEIG